MRSSGAIVHPGPEPGLLWSVLLFVRFSGIGFSLSLPLLGAGTVVPSLSAAELIGLCLVAACFHGYVFVLNDVIDLDVDRTEPRRAGFPLVRGTISPATALAFALVQFPISLAVAVSLGVPARGLLVLSAAYVLGLIYNVWGKRTPVPMITDAAQSLAWGCLVAFGALATGGRTAVLTWVVFAYVGIYVLMINGVHGGLRDLANDRACAVRSTAIRLGAYVGADGRARFSSALRRYAVVLQCALIALALAGVLVTVRESAPAAGVAALAVVATSSAVALLLLWSASRPSHVGFDAGPAGLLHMLSAMIPVMAMLVPRIDATLAAIIIAAFGLPILTHSLTYRSVRWAWRALRGGLAG